MGYLIPNGLYLYTENVSKHEYFRTELNRRPMVRATKAVCVSDHATTEIGSLTFIYCVICLIETLTTV
jgi:hypothetical protein